MTFLLTLVCSVLFFLSGWLIGFAAWQQWTGLLLTLVVYTLALGILGVFRITVSTNPKSKPD